MSSASARLATRREKKAMSGGRNFRVNRSSSEAGSALTSLPFFPSRHETAIRAKCALFFLAAFRKTRAPSHADIFFTNPYRYTQLVYTARRPAHPSRHRLCCHGARPRLATAHKRHSGAEQCGNGRTVQGCSLQPGGRDRNRARPATTPVVRLSSTASSPLTNNFRTPTLSSRGRT